MTFGKKLRELIDWSPENQKSLSEKTGIARSTLNGYVNDTSSPTIDMAQKIADALGVSLWTLLNGDPMEITPSDISQRERKLVGAYRALLPDEMELVDHTLEVLGKNKPLL